MKIIKLLSIVLFTAYSSSVMALPALQLGPGGTGTWGYVAGGDDTWYTASTNFELSAYANATTDDGGHGDYAWDPDTSNKQFAYLVAAATPNTADDGTDAFDISIIGDDNSPLSMVSSGWGTPPIDDSNALAPHGVFGTYFEVYEFRFNDPAVLIGNTQPEPYQDPSDSDPGQGYAESFGITINSMLAGVAGVHFDLFTVVGDKWFPNKDVAEVKTFAPFSHDAEYTSVPEPAIPGLLAIGLLGLVIARRKKA